MSNAFKCDGCDEFHEGSPERYRAQKCKVTSISGWVKEQNVHRMELCGDCADEFEKTLYDFVGDDDG
jgi:hypothetical protein